MTYMQTLNNVLDTQQILSGSSYYYCDQNEGGTPLWIQKYG